MKNKQGQEQNNEQRQILQPGHDDLEKQFEDLNIKIEDAKKVLEDLNAEIDNKKSGNVSKKVINKKVQPLTYAEYIARNKGGK